MTLQVLVSTMHQKDYSLLEKMNIQTDAIIVNQCDTNEITEFTFRGHSIKWISLCERGVGLSRNTALMRATADIVLFADDDVVYADNLEGLVVDEFRKNPKRGVIVFNLESQNPERKEAVVKKPYRLRWYNCLKFGSFRIAAKREPVIFNNIFFSLLFGGGAAFSAGEDNLFITQCLKNGLSGWASEQSIGTVKQEDSTWFSGYHSKYYHDRGVLFYKMYGLFAYIVSFLINLKNTKGLALSFAERVSCEIKGISYAKRIR